MTAPIINISSDLTFLTNEPGKHLSDRFGVLLGTNTRFFDCLVGYFFISGFHKLHPALSKTEKIRILVGIKTDRATYDLIQTAKEQQEFVLESHAQVRQQLPGEGGALSGEHVLFLPGFVIWSLSAWFAKL
jgi:hypothetical protein